MNPGYLVPAGYEAEVADELRDSPGDGLSKSTIGRIWLKSGLKPHLTGTFKLSADPYFVEKVVGVVGLYHKPAGEGGAAVRG